MAFNAVEIIALVLVLLVIVKLLIVSFSPKSWLGLVKALYSTPVILFFVELILAAIVFYYLLQQLTIIQIMAAIALGALLTGMSFAIYGKETIAWGTKLLRDKSFLRKAWLPILIWLALAVWTLMALF
ncbi:hypothetical protein LCGC14_2953570 [marine sediment metagenome]|uniref:Uncharacterized protein n=1 Tax=marine sediment metagenome TaxID=412755 RepID=A0A0F8XF54_9ZZZZ